MAADKRFLRILTLTLGVIMIFTTAAGCSKETEKVSNKPIDKLIEEDGLVYGILIPWFETNTYGIDIGRNFRTGYKSCSFNETVVRHDFANCKAMGFNMVKIWLSEIMEGVVFDSEGNVTGADEVFMQNLKRIFDIAAELDVNLAITMVSHLSYSAASEEEYRILTRFIFESDITKQYIDNFLTPVLTLAKEYDNIMLIDLYAEPEGDLYDEGATNTKQGTTWAKMGSFIRSIATAARAINPDWAITASSGWSEYRNLDKYKDWNLDYIGVDIYNDTGILTDVSDLNLNLPVMLGEFGPMQKKNWSDEFQIKLTRHFFSDAVKKGYSGAFFWMYGYKGSGEALTLIDNDGNLRSTALSLRYDSLDREYAKTGYTGMDKPAFFYTENNSDIKFFGSRGALSYIIERSADGSSWSQVAEIDSSDSAHLLSENMFFFTDESVQPGETFYYRVTAVNDSGCVVSDISLK